MRRCLQRTDGSIIFWRNTTSIINDFDGLQAVIFEADLYSRLYASQVYGAERQEKYKPMFVAPASRAFSTSSFVAVWRSMTT